LHVPGISNCATPDGVGGVRFPSQALPPAEMGTAQQEIPVAKFIPTSFKVSLTQEEVWILQEALDMLRSHSEESIMFASALPDSLPIGCLETLIKEFKQATES